MPKVNYIQEQKSFADYANKYRLSAGERLLWQALFNVFNTAAMGDEWTDDFIEIRMETLMSQTGKSRDTIYRARQKLIKRGLISFRDGEGALSPARYHLFYLSVYGIPEETVLLTGDVDPNQVAFDFMTGANFTYEPENAQPAAVSDCKERVSFATVPSQNATVPSQNATVNSIYHNPIEYKQDINVVDSIIYNNNNKAREQASVRENGAVGERDEKRKLRFKYASALKAQFRISFGREANPEEISAMLTALEGMKGLDADLLRYAIRKAAQNGARTPGAYFASLAEYWREYGITNIEQWDEVDYLRQRMAASKGTRFEEMFERKLSELSGKLTGRIRAAAV